MDRKLVDTYIEYYKNERENDKRYMMREALEERDAYRVISSLNHQSKPIQINGYGDLARLLIAARNITIPSGRDIYEEFMNSPQVEEFMRKRVLESPELGTLIPNYEAPDWPEERPLTPMEKDLQLMQDFYRYNGKEKLLELRKNINGAITAKNAVDIQFRGNIENGLTDRQKQIIALSKVLVRLKEKRPSREPKIQR